LTYPTKPSTTVFHRWSDKGVFKLIFSELARFDGTETEEVLMIDAVDRKADRPASSRKEEC